MLTPEQEAKVNQILTDAGVKADALAGVAAQLILAVMVAADAPTPEDVMPVDVMPAAAPATPAPAAEGAAQQSLAASREVIAAQSRRLSELEAKEAAREKEDVSKLFAMYKKEGRFRHFSIAGSDPDGTKKAQSIFAKGVSFAKEVFEAISPLTGTTAPAAPQGLTRNSTPSKPGQSRYTGDDHGAALHDEVMGELKAKNLNMTEYPRLADQFSRQK